MPTLLQLQSEPAWQAEFTPPSLRALRVRLAQHFAVPLANIGTRGNEFHLSGYHRSRRWIKQSAYCVSRTYSVSRTPGDRSGGSDDAVSAMDITLPRAQLLGMCQRLDVAVRAGRLEKITEWYGNTDGDQRVDGYDNLSDRVASSDSSHLWHAHLSFDRGRVAEDHADLFAILTGVDDDMTPEQANALTDALNILTGLANGVDEVTVHDKDGRLSLLPYYDKVAAKVTLMQQSLPLTLTDEDVEEVAEAVATRLRALRFVADTE
jgi:hypothetical protein